MTENTRDTQFLGFAHLLLEQMLRSDDAYIDETNGYWQEHWETIIAQRAYDLACHVSTETILVAHGDMNKITDLIAWPPTEEAR